MERTGRTECVGKEASSEEGGVGVLRRRRERVVRSWARRASTGSRMDTHMGIHIGIDRIYGRLKSKI